MFTKMQVTNNYLEKFDYTHSGNSNSSASHHFSSKWSDLSTEDNSSTTKNLVRTLIGGNFFEDNGVKDKFISLTFKNTKKFDISNLSECNVRHQIFIKKLQKLHPNLKYIMIPEVQKERNAIHYHMLTNIPYMEKKTLQKLWPYGFSDIRVKDSYIKAGKYLTKYLTKDKGNESFFRKRRVYTSHNLYRTYVVGDTDTQAHLLGYIWKFKHKWDYTYQFETEWQGECRYSCIKVDEEDRLFLNLPRDEV
jgi:hypothetical protein